MGIFKRLRTLTVASVNDVIDSMEDPVVMLNQYMRDMEAEIGQVEVAVARQVALEKRFRQQWEETTAIVDKRERQVNLALSTGDDELARRALVDKKLHESRAQEFETLYKAAADAAGQMREKLAELKDEFYKLRAKKFTLMSRAQVARTQKQVNQAITGMCNENASRGFARMEEKVMRMEAEAEMSGQWKEARLAAIGLDERFQANEPNEIDLELAARKEKLSAQKSTEPQPDTQGKENVVLNK